MSIADPLKNFKSKYLFSFTSRLKDKINHPPKNVDEQEVSKQFKNFVRMKQMTKDGKSSKILKSELISQKIQPKLSPN